MEHIKQITQHLKSNVDGLDIIYLFGSQAEGSVHKNSDLDIAIKCKSSITSTQLWEIANELADIAKCDVDLIDLSIASSVMRMQIVSKGICLYAQDKHETAVFEDFVYSDYVRLNEERAEILSDITVRGTVYG